MGTYTFYGSDPPDWSEGACDGHLFSLQFQNKPEDSQLERIAETFERGLAKGPASPASQPWLWSDRFATFYLGERWSSDVYDSPAFLVAAERFLDDIHRISPIVDAIFHGAHGDPPPVGQLSPGPDFGIETTTGPFGRPVDPSFPPAAPNPVVEAARARTREELAEAKIDEAVGKQKRGMVGMQRTTITPPPASEPDISAWREVVDQANLPEPYSGPKYHRIIPHSANERCLVCSRERVFKIDETGAYRSLFAAKVGIESVTDANYLFDGRVVVATDKKLRVFDVSAPLPKMLHSLVGGGNELTIVRDGRVVVSGPKPRVVAYAAGKFKLIGSFDTHLLTFTGEQDGKLIYAGGASYFEVTGLDEIYDKFAKRVQKKPAKATNKKLPAAAKAEPANIELRPVDLATLEPPAPEVSPEVIASFPPGSLIWQCKQGRSAALAPKRKPQPGCWAPLYKLEYLDDKGKVVKLTTKIHGKPWRVKALSQLALSEDGATLFVRAYNDTFAVDTATQDVQSVIGGQWEFHGNLIDMDPLDARQVLLLGERRWLWMRKDKDSWEKVADAKLSKPEATAVVETPAGFAAVVLSDSKNRLEVFALVNNTLSSVGVLREPVQSLEARGGRIVTHLAGESVEVVGLEGVVAAAAARPSPSEKKAVKKKAAKPEVTHDAIDPKLVPPEIPPAMRRRLKVKDKDARFRCSANGLEGALCQENSSFHTLVLGGKPPRHIDISGIQSVSGFDISRDGTVYLSTIRSFIRLPQDAGEPELILSIDLDKRPSNYGEDICVLNDNALLALGSRRLELLRRGDDGSWRVVDKRNVKYGERLLPVREFGLVVVLTKSGLELFGVKRSKNKLQRLTTLEAFLDRVSIVEDRRILVRDVNKAAWEFGNLAEVVETVLA